TVAAAGGRPRDRAACALTPADLRFSPSGRTWGTDQCLLSFSVPPRMAHCFRFMDSRTLYEKVFDSHVIRQETDGTALLYIDRHLVHEVTSPQAFEGLRLAGRMPWRAQSIVATADHNTPTKDW